MDRFSYLSKIIESEPIDDLSIENLILNSLNGGFNPAQIASYLTAIKLNKNYNYLKHFVKVIRSKILPLEKDILNISVQNNKILEFLLSSLLASLNIENIVFTNDINLGKNKAKNILKSLDIPVIEDMNQLDKIIKQSNMCFFYSINHKKTMREISEVVKDLPFKTIYEYAFPLTFAYRNFQVIYDEMVFAHILESSVYLNLDITLILDRDPNFKIAKVENQIISYLDMNFDLNQLVIDEDSSIARYFTYRMNEKIYSLKQAIYYIASYLVINNIKADFNDAKDHVIASIEEDVAIDQYCLFINSQDKEI